MIINEEKLKNIITQVLNEAYSEDEEVEEMESSEEESEEEDSDEEVDTVEAVVESVIIEMIENGELDIKVLSEIFGSFKGGVKKGKSLPGVDYASRMKDVKFAYDALKDLVPGEMDNPLARKNASNALAKFISKTLRPQAGGTKEKPLDFFIKLTGDSEDEVKRVLSMAFDTIKGKI
jgi:hypothetical protein